MSEGLATPLKSVLSCPVCSNRYDDAARRPKFLMCFHTACMTCLLKSFKQGKVMCPSCKRPTETESVSKLPDNTQLVTLVLNMSSLNLSEAVGPKDGKDMCSVHSARINFWCQTCKTALCRDCTVLAHRQAMGHKVLDHDEAVSHLRAEVRQASQDTRNLRQETRKLRHDQRQYLNRQLEACKAFEKQLKQQLKALSSDRKEEQRALERMETEAGSSTSLIALIDAASKAGEARLAAARDFAMAKKAMTDNLLAVTQLNRSNDELDSLDEPSGGYGAPGSPNFERRGGKYSARGVRSWTLTRPALSFDMIDMQAKIRPLPKVYIDLAIEGIQQRGRIVIELRPDKAPRLCENFSLLCSGEKGFGFKGCKVFRCLPGWWVQAGDFATNDGEGGRSAFDDDLIEAETTDLEAKPGAVEMVCVASSDRGALLVGSQFFIHVKKYTYTHVFAYVVEGLDLIERLSQLGDSTQAYHPSQEITIVDAGRIQQT